MNIILIGFMACGKSSVGRALAEQTGMKLIDLDAMIVEKAGMCIPDIFSSVGEKAFRDLESHCVQLVSKEKNAIIATGGGVILREKNRDLLRHGGLVVWLKTTAENVAKYSARNDDRPLLKDGKGISDIQKMMDTREDFYRTTSHLSIKGYTMNLPMICEKILDNFYQLSND